MTAKPKTVRELAINGPVLHTSDDGTVKLISLEYYRCHGSVFVSVELAEETAKFLGRKVYRCQRGHIHITPRKEPDEPKPVQRNQGHTRKPARGRKKIRRRGRK